MANKDSFNFQRIQRRWDAEQSRIPVIVARLAENRFKRAFRESAFDPAGTGGKRRWPGRKKKDPGRALLVKSGKLKRGIRTKPGSNFEAPIKTKNEVFYGRFHNDGIPGRLPQRQFIGDSISLNMKIRSEIKRTINRIFK